jgi:protein associated with RNAse G/E
LNGQVVTATQGNAATDEQIFIYVEIVTMTHSVWQILSQKYDRRPHYTWPAILLDDDGQQLRFATVVGGKFVHYSEGSEEVIHRPSDLTFWRGRWYNVFTNYHEDGTLHYFYCNVALPPLIERYTITFIDLDLDVQVWPDGSSRLLDAGEFERHCVRYGYPDQVQNNALQAVNDILALAEACEGPFSILARRDAT